MSATSRSGAVSAAALGAALEAGKGKPLAAAPARTGLAVDAMGAAGSRDALSRLNAAIGELKAMAVEPLLQRSVSALQAGDVQLGAEWALKALQQDERSGFGWYLLAIARERAGDFANSVTCYESALALLPDHSEVANDLGRLAFRLGMSEVAEKLFRHFLASRPDHPEGANNLACALREQARYDDAVELLRPAIMASPEHPMLWNTMGTIVAEQGDVANADIFFAEALRLDPGFAKARYNRGNGRLALGDAEGALADCEAALAAVAAPDERAMMELSRSTILMALGRIGEGWDSYEARLDPQFSDVTHFAVDRPRWTPDAELEGRSMLVIGEQGLGDEILFANLIPDLLAALGPDGRLTLAVERRLVDFFQRSFPTARVGAHATYGVGGRTVRVLPFLEGELEGVDLWAPLASLLRRFRRSPSDFPEQPGYMAADPERVAHWRKVLATAPAGRKVGLLWKSAVSTNARHRFFSPFDQWATVLAAPGVTFVNLQYGDVAAELEQARTRLGVEIWTPPGIDLKQDLDEVAALGCALDLTVGFSNASFNLAAACGAPAWLITAPGVWPRLGSPDRYYWYPQTRVFAPAVFGGWEAVMTEVGGALADWA